MIWVPSAFGFDEKGNPKKNPTPSADADGPDDTVLILQLTTEQWTFGPPLGKIKNRGFGKQKDIHLEGIAYMQTVQNVTNPDTGKGDRPKKATGSGIHFESGMWLYAPKAESFQTKDSIVRMASIPHGTTIMAEGHVPASKTPETGGPDFGKLNTTPFFINDKETIPQTRTFESPMKADRPNRTRRVPQNLSSFIKAGTITADIIKNPNTVLANAANTVKILDHIVFEGLPSTAVGPPTLAGKQTEVTTQAPGFPNADPAGGPNSHTAFMSSQWWVETVEYDLFVPSMEAGDTIMELRPIMKPGSPHEASTPKFNIKAPPKNHVRAGGVSIKVRGIQIQYSQMVHLKFGPLTWPHVSVATLVPTDAQFYEMKPADLIQKKAGK